MSDFIEIEDDMDCPCPCQKCGKWFDLHDGYGSKKWYPNTVICKRCYQEEKEEVERDDEIEELKEEISDGKEIIKNAQDRLIELGVDISEL